MIQINLKNGTSYHVNFQHGEEPYTVPHKGLTFNRRFTKAVLYKGPVGTLRKDMPAVAEGVSKTHSNDKFVKATGRTLSMRNLISDYLSTHEEDKVAIPLLMEAFNRANKEKKIIVLDEQDL